MGERKKTRLTEKEQKLKERLMRSESIGIRRKGSGRVSEEYWKMPKPEISKDALLRALLDDRREGR